MKFNMLNTSTIYITLQCHPLPYKHARFINKESFKKGKKFTTFEYNYTFLTNTEHIQSPDM